MDTLFIGVILVVFIGFTYWSNKQRKKQQDAKEQFVNSLAKGIKVVTTSGLVGQVDKVENGLVTINSEGSKSAWLVQAVNEYNEPVKNEPVQELADKDDSKSIEGTSKE